MYKQISPLFVSIDINLKSYNINRSSNNWTSAVVFWSWPRHCRTCTVLDPETAAIFGSGEWLDKVNPVSAALSYTSADYVLSFDNWPCCLATITCCSRSFDWMDPLPFAIQRRLVPAFDGVVSSTLQTGLCDAGPRWKLAPGSVGSSLISAFRHKELISLVGLVIRPIYILCAS
jgi:hypothetical protein